MYVISIKRITNYDYPDYTLREKPEWEYLGYDTGSAYCTGYPCWTSFSRCEKYSTLEDAINEWKSVSKNGMNIYLKNSKDYDITSIAIRKIEFKTIKKLSIINQEETK